MNFSTVDIMEVEVSSSSLDRLMNFAQSLEKRGYRVSITGRTKMGPFTTRIGDSKRG